jgi:hypothetical protein
MGSEALGTEVSDYLAKVPVLSADWDEFEYDLLGVESAQLEIHHYALLVAVVAEAEASQVGGSQVVLVVLQFLHLQLAFLLVF